MKIVRFVPCEQSLSIFLENKDIPNFHGKILGAALFERYTFLANQPKY